MRNKYNQHYGRWRTVAIRSQGISGCDINLFFQEYSGQSSRILGYYLLNKHWTYIKLMFALVIGINYGGKGLVPLQHLYAVLL